MVAAEELQALLRRVIAAVGPSAPPVTPGAPAAPKAAGAPESPAPAAASPTPEKPAAAKTPDAPKTDDAEKQRLSGKHWKDISDKKWPGSTSVDTLSDAFKPKAQAFLAMLEANSIRYDISATLRPKERSYLFHYCLEVANGRMKPKDVPAQDGVDINWDHGDDAKSKAAAKEMADAFGLVGVAAHPSNHNAGDAMDMKLDFSKNTKDGKNELKYAMDGKEKTRAIQIDDEATVGKSASGKKITNISDRELSKAGADFGVKRAIDSDIVHWSLTGR